MSDMALLCLDRGNTRLKWGLHANGAWLAQGVLADVAELPAALAALPRPQRAFACNVAGAAAQAAIEAALARLQLPLAWCRSEAAACGVKNGYAEPAQLGADRWAALVGARALCPAACLVVNAGTATTIDVLDAVGRFRGGLILPGIALMRAALAGNTAQLPGAGGVFRPLPDNTADAIASGCVQATLGAMERMFAPLAAEPAALCLLSGGAAAELTPGLNLPWRMVDNLVLEGLARIGAGPENAFNIVRE